jgi:hypothetical protein
MPRTKRGKKKNKRQRSMNPDSGKPAVVTEVDDSEASQPMQGQNESEVVHDHEGISNRWNGARVVDASEFLSSGHAFPLSMDEPVCAAYALQEVKDMFLKVLPLDTALVSDLFSLFFPSW